MSDKGVKGAAPPGLALNLLTRILIAPTLVHHDIVRECPDGDLRVLRILGLLILLSGAWQATLWSNAAKIMLSAEGAWQPAPIAVGVLMAAIIGLVDVLVFIAASWNAQGLVEVERTYEFKLPTTRSERVKKAALIGGRFLMTVLIANAMATTAARHLYFVRTRCKKTTRRRPARAIAPPLTEQDRPGSMTELVTLSRSESMAMHA